MSLPEDSCSNRTRAGSSQSDELRYGAPGRHGDGVGIHIHDILGDGGPHREHSAHRLDFGPVCVQSERGSEVSSRDPQLVTVKPAVLAEDRDIELDVLIQVGCDQRDHHHTLERVCSVCWSGRAQQARRELCGGRVPVLGSGGWRNFTNIVVIVGVGLEEL
eukprot:7385901-Prymnesium_polylepis.1